MKKYINMPCPRRPGPDTQPAKKKTRVNGL